MATLQKIDILSLGRLKTEAVQLDNGDEIIISELGASDGCVLFTDPQYQTAGASLDMALFTPALLARTIVDTEGARLFADTDAAAIARWPAQLSNKLVAVALRLNGLDKQSHDTEIKNSVPSPE